jgi:hypothetical protein
MVIEWEFTGIHGIFFFVVNLGMLAIVHDDFMLI